MRIIRAAKQIEEWQQVCRKCKSIIGIAQNDVKYDSMENENYVICPVCHETISLPSKDLMFKWIMEEENNEVPGDNSMRQYSL